MKFDVDGYHEYDGYLRKWRVVLMASVFCDSPGKVVQMSEPPKCKDRDGVITIRPTAWETWYSTEQDAVKGVFDNMASIRASLEAGEYTLGESGYIVLTPKSHNFATKPRP